MKSKGSSSQKNSRSGVKRKPARDGAAGGSGTEQAAAMTGDSSDLLQRELDDKRQLSADIIRTADALIIGLDTEGRVQLMNPAAERITGYTLDEVKGRNWFETIVPRMRYPKVWEEFSRLRSGGQPTMFENPIVTKGGEERIIAWSNSEVLRGGNVTGTLSVGIDITKQKRASEDLRRSEEKYRDLFENAIDAICIVDRNQNYLDVNRRSLELFGYSREEFLSMNVRDMLPPEQLARSEKEFEKLTESGAYEKFTGKVRKKDGSYIDVEVSSAAIVEHGQVIGSRDIIRDITERRKAETLLRDSESRMRSIVESSPVGMHIYRLEPDGRLVFTAANPAADRILGVDNRIFIGKTIEEAFPPLKETEVPQRYRDVARSGKAWQTESIEYQDNAIKGAFEVHAFRVAPNSIVAAFEDITDRKRAEQALRESESRYKAIIESQAEFVVRYQPGGIITFVNDTLCRYANMKREDLLGRSYYPLMHPDDRDAFIRKIEALDRENPVMVAEARVVLPDGREPWHQWTHHAIFNDGGDLVEYQCTGRDVTELKQAEARIKESEKKYRTLFESSTDGIFIVDFDGNLIDANPIAYQRLGYTREELLSLQVSKLTAPEFAARVPDRIKQVREQGVVMFETAHRRKDGSVMPVEVNSRLFDYEGRPVLFSTVRDITERKRAEAEIAERGAMLQQILNTSSVAIFLVDMSGRVTQANRRMAEMFGRTMEELAGREYVELVHPSEREDGRAKMLALLASRIPSVDLERHYWRKDGTEFWGHLAGRRFYDVRGNELGLIGVISDITERKQAEDALRKSEKMLQTIIDAEPECVKLLDENANLIMMNRAGLDMLQVDSLDEVNGQCVCPLIASEYRLTFLDLTKRVFQGESGTLLFEMVGLKGRHLWLETHAVPLRNEKDEIIALLGVTRDITERKQALDALQQSEARFRAMIESASIGILVADVETKKFLYANPEICRLLRYSEQDFLSLTALDLAVPEELPDSVAGFHAHVEGKLKATERTLTRKNGSTVKMSINSVRMEFDGRPCLVGFFTDITEKRLLEEERLKAQKLESIGTLAGGIAHDFNNLLQGVFGYISMAKLTIDQREKSLTMLVQAEKALHQSVNLASQLLTFSKGGKPVKKVVDLRSVIENAVKFALSGSQVTYDLSFGDDLCAVDADEGQIGQVVQNIVLNAEQTMPLGGRIEIAARNVPPSQAAGLPLPASHGLVEIVVRDQGTGIPPEHLPRIFDPYFTTKEKGSGLGLATSYSIVKNHDGMISVSSELGKGSAFTVYLPASREAQEQEAASASVVLGAGRKGRVLVMDDEPIIRLVAGELLQELGHEAEFSEHGDSAIEKYRRAKADGRPFDVVILDLTIRGGMGGLETLRKLKEIDPGVKAVVSSGYSDDEVVATYRQHGFCSFLKKPYDMRELSRMLGDVMA